MTMRTRRCNGATQHCDDTPYESDDQTDTYAKTHSEKSKSNRQIVINGLAKGCSCWSMRS